MDIITQYGALNNCKEVTYHPNGLLATAFTHTFTKLNTPCGAFNLAYDFTSERRKYIPSVKFFKSGTLQAINLDQQEEIPTASGTFPCEHISFYPNGNPCRLLHLNGKLSGYWSEEQETELAKIVALNLPCGLIKSKIMTLHLYDNGSVASITLFPGAVVDVKTNIGEIKTRIGISFYQNGLLKSLEPAIPTKIQTPIGKVMSFDTEPLGLSGDNNSLQWHENGHLFSCKTTDTLDVPLMNGNVKTIAPKEILSMCGDDELVKIPYEITWDENQTIISGTSQEPIVIKR